MRFDEASRGESAQKITKLKLKAKQTNQKIGGGGDKNKVTQTL